MHVDFREERKWKMSLAFNLSTAVLEWHAAGNLTERLEKGICIGGKRSRFQDDDSEQDVDIVGEQIKLGTEEFPHPEQPKASLLQVDYGSDEDDDDDESVVDQQNVLDTLDPAVLVEDALSAPQEDAGTHDKQPKVEDVEESISKGDGNADTLIVEEQDAMKVDALVLDIPKLKATSSDPILGSNSAPRNNEVELAAIPAKSSLKTTIYAPLRESIIYSNDDKLFLGTDDFHNLLDDALLPPSDLSSIFPDLQPFGLFDVSATLAPSANEGKKRSDKRSERDDPTKRSEDTTYTKLFPAGEFMYSKPTLLGPLNPSRYFKNNQWSSEESAVLPDSDSSGRISDNVLSGELSLTTFSSLPDFFFVLVFFAELFDSRSSNSPASMMALQLQTTLLKERDPRRRGADHLWSASDDTLLKSVIDKYPNNWALISECFNASRLTISIDKRTPRDCLERWKEKWGSEIRQRPTESPMVVEDVPPASGQMTTRGVKRLASTSVSAPSAIPGNEPRKRRRHMLVQESIRKATKKRAESAQKVIGEQLSVYSAELQ
jgi:chromatin modification-related protein VID21